MAEIQGIEQLVARNKAVFLKNSKDGRLEIKKIKDFSSVAEFSSAERTTWVCIYSIGGTEYIIKKYRDEEAHRRDLSNLQEIKKIRKGTPGVIASDDAKRITITEKMNGWNSLFEDMQYCGAIDNCTCLYDLTPMLRKKVDQAPFYKGIEEAAGWLAEYHRHFLKKNKAPYPGYAKDLEDTIKFLSLWGKEAEAIRQARRANSKTPTYMTRIHGDFNLGNILLFEKDGKRTVSAIDFTQSREGMPGEDVGSFLANTYHVLGERAPKRKEIMRRFLETYLKHFANNKYKKEILATAPLYIAEHLKAVMKVDKATQYRKQIKACLECDELTPGWIEKTL